MKKLFFTLFSLLALQLSATTLGNDKQISFNELPAQSQQLIKQYFSNQPIALVKEDSDLFDKSYEVLFTNGDKIEFDKKGKWETIDCRYTYLPTDLVPKQILNHVNKNYSDIKIISIEKESKGGYEIVLSNGLDLDFDTRFNLINIDN